MVLQDGPLRLKLKTYDQPEFLQFQLHFKNDLHHSFIKYYNLCTIVMNYRQCFSILLTIVRLLIAPIIQRPLLASSTSKGEMLLRPGQQHEDPNKEVPLNHLINKLSLFPIIIIAPLFHSFQVHSFYHPRD